MQFKEQQQTVDVMQPFRAASYFLHFASWAQANHVTYCYFEAYDEPWKASRGQ